MVLETVFTSDSGSVAVIDFMPVGLCHSAIVRIVEARAGRVAMWMDLAPRFEYGAVVPDLVDIQPDTWHGMRAVAGTEQLALRASVPVRREAAEITARFVLGESEHAVFVLAYGDPPPLDGEISLTETEEFWHHWSSRNRYSGPYGDAVMRSLLVLKALTHAPTGGIVAAPTTSLPEQIGGSRNWDYRYCWLRDSAFTALEFIEAGYGGEVEAWCSWLERTLGDDPEPLDILYGLGGERMLAERVLDWLPGYQGARPVRIGNAASDQMQHDIHGEVAEALHRARAAGMIAPLRGWAVQCAMLRKLETVWDQPDEGIWEVRGGRRHFTFSKAMAWVAFDRAVRDGDTFGLPGPVEHWRALRDHIHTRVCLEGFDPARGAFTQSFGDPALDASLLLLAPFRFLPPEDARLHATLRAIGEALMPGGLVDRYVSLEALDGLPAGEGAFLACSFWMVEHLALAGELVAAEDLFARLLALRNDVGLIAEEYDPVLHRMTGNFPQGFSHLSLVRAAFVLARAQVMPGRVEGRA